MVLVKLISWIVVIIMLSGVFTAGWVANSLYGDLNGFNLEKPFYLSLFGVNKPKDVASPYDHISKDQIHVFSDRIVIDIENAGWAEFTDTNSMDPLFDVDANSFEIKPKDSDDVHVGDIVSYSSSFTTGLIVHRVVDISEDEDGWFAIAKGDNLTSEDPGKIRFEQINGILVGVIY